MSKNLIEILEIWFFWQNEWNLEENASWIINLQKFFKNLILWVICTGQVEVQNKSFQE